MYDLRVIFGAAVATALCVRILHLHAVSRTPFFTGLVADAQAYALDAQQLLEQGVIDSGFYRPPLYAYLRAGLALLGASSPWALGIAHSIAGSLSCGLLGVAAWRLVPDDHPRVRVAAAWIAGIAAALYGPLVVYDVEMLPQAWVNLLIALAYVLCLNRSRSVRWTDLAAGSCIGLATTGWAPAAVLAVPMLALRLQHVGGSRLKTSVAFLAALAAAPSMTALHNAAHGAPGIVVSGNLGINLWLGNNPRWRDTAKARPGIFYDMEYRRPTQAGATTLPARELYYLQLVGEELAARPLAALMRTGQKLYIFAHGREVRRDQDLNWLREQSPVVAALLWNHPIKFPFGLLLPLALVCPASAVRHRGKAILLLGTAGYGCVLALFTMAARYRLPVVLLLLPLASIGVAVLVAAACNRFDERSSRPLKPFAPRAAAFGLAVLACNAPLPYTASFAASPAERLLMLAQAHAASGNLGRALQLTAQALERAPVDVDALVQLGRFSMGSGLILEAAYYFRRAGEVVPESEAPWILHGQAMMLSGHRDHAIYSFGEALKRNPHHPDALRELARAYLITGRDNLAIETLHRYLAGYRDDWAADNLVRLILEKRGTAAAAVAARDLQRRYPRWSRPRSLVSDLERQQNGTR